MNSAVNPNYYQDLPNGYQNIDLASRMSFNAGNAEKYIFRSCKVNGVIKGEPLKDLNKAKWYISKEIEICTELISKQSNFSRFIGRISSQGIFSKSFKRFSESTYRKGFEYSDDKELVETVKGALTFNGQEAILHLIRAHTHLKPSFSTTNNLKIALTYVDKEIKDREESEDYDVFDKTCKQSESGA